MITAEYFRFGINSILYFRSCRRLLYFRSMMTCKISWNIATHLGSEHYCWCRSNVSSFHCLKILTATTFDKLPEKEKFDLEKHSLSRFLVFALKHNKSVKIWTRTLKDKSNLKFVFSLISRQRILHKCHKLRTYSTCERSITWNIVNWVLVQLRYCLHNVKFFIPKTWRHK